MKEAIGNTFIMNFIIIFTIIFIVLFIGATTYTKALRIKNRITDIIEENNGYTTSMSDANGEITQYLKEAGYRVSSVNASDCKINGQAVDVKSIVYPSSTTSSNYDYCIFEYNTKKGKYYGVKTYMYLDLPIIGDKIKLGVYGETKVIGILGS